MLHMAESLPAYHKSFWLPPGESCLHNPESQQANYSLFPSPCSPAYRQAGCSLFPVPCSLFPSPYSLAFSSYHYIKKKSRWLTGILMLICCLVLFSTKSSRTTGKVVVKITEVTGSVCIHLYKYNKA